MQFATKGKMVSKPYYFISFLDSDHLPKDSDIYISLYPIGYLLIGEGEWPSTGSGPTINAYFSIQEAIEALKMISMALNSKDELIHSQTFPE